MLLLLATVGNSECSCSSKDDLLSCVLAMSLITAYVAYDEVLGVLLCVTMQQKFLNSIAQRCYQNPWT